jgi:hypothetical protein
MCRKTRSSFGTQKISYIGKKNTELNIEIHVPNRPKQIVSANF